MGYFEMSDSFLNITKIWSVFLNPVLSVVIVFLLICFIVGKENIYQTCKKCLESLVVKIDDKYYWKKWIKLSKASQKSTLKKTAILVPLSKLQEDMVLLLQKPIAVLVISLFSIYSVYQLLLFLSDLCPITYRFNGCALLIHNTVGSIIVDIWAHYPKISLYSLYEIIISMEGGDNYIYNNQLVIMISNISKLCVFGLVIGLFIALISDIVHKRFQTNIYIKMIVSLLLCILIMLLSFDIIVSLQAKTIQQKAFYVNRQLMAEEIEHNSGSETSNNALYSELNERIEEEKECIPNCFTVEGPFNLEFDVPIVYF